MIVVFPDGKQAKCKVLGADYTRDVGLAKIIEPGKYPFAELGDSDKLQTTTIVIALGHPGGYDVRRSPPAVRRQPAAPRRWSRGRGRSDRTSAAATRPDVLSGPTIRVTC
jgi:S1-C subfamily serine protease